ncbi:MAG: hypothetical protein Ta2E_00350 [Mycoplasmoidaceae bacterium]|nr:MAG: hypothetical protein Ta2E_00350 [Mycoplasmoidaceae bacterium]
MKKKTKSFFFKFLANPSSVVSLILFFLNHIKLIIYDLTIKISINLLQMFEILSLPSFCRLLSVTSRFIIISLFIISSRFIVICRFMVIKNYLDMAYPITSIRYIWIPKFHVEFIFTISFVVLIFFWSTPSYITGPTTPL